jgi:signal transduction histidine kinase
MLSQLLANLLRNAIEAMQDGGSLLVEAFTPLEPPARRRVTLRVTDTGTGIDTSIRHRLFEPFFTTKISGTGLGLALCQRIAEVHGAVLTISPRPDQHGTIVEVCFPAADAASLLVGGPPGGRDVHT